MLNKLCFRKVNKQTYMSQSITGLRHDNFKRFVISQIFSSFSVKKMEHEKI